MRFASLFLLAALAGCSSTPSSASRGVGPTGGKADREERPEPICTADLSGRGLEITKGCLLEEGDGGATIWLEEPIVEGQVGGEPMTMTFTLPRAAGIEEQGASTVYRVVLEGDDLAQLGGSLGRLAGQADAIELSITLERRDRVRSEGALRDHFVGDIRVATRIGDGAFETFRSYEDLHFYRLVEQVAHDVHWGYGPDDGPLTAAWGGDCGGHSQSPIALEQGLVVDDVETHVRLSYVPSRLTRVNNGHALMASVVAEGGTRQGARSELTLEREGVERTFELLQFHVHTPSEHVFADGETREYPIEIHFVHKEVGGDRLAVIGVLAEERDDCQSNAVAAALLDGFPREVNRPVELAQSVNPLELMPEQRSYVSYSGSLTTPPCSEIVTWLVNEQIGCITPSDLARVHELIGGEEGHAMNARRPLSDLNEREISRVGE